MMICVRLSRSALWSHAEPLAAHTPVHAQQAGHADAGILILSIELLDDACRGRNYADLAKSSAGGAIAPIGGDIRHGGELPDIRTLAAVQLERACRGPKLHHQDIDVFPNVLIA